MRHLFSIFIALTLLACSDPVPHEGGADATGADQEANKGECSVDADCIGKITIAPCEMVTCNVEQKKCELTTAPEETPCNDGDPCTVGERCQDAACTGSAQKSCDDDDACTDDACVAGGDCEHVLNTAACDDGNPCTEADTCDDGACAGVVSETCFKGSCCDVQNHPGCGDEAVRACVCAINEGCCTDNWNAACVELVNKAECGACEVATCGDLTCDEGETCASCPSDCGACIVCGDGACDATETCSDCAEDCGDCPPPVCGDDLCAAEESCADCPQDCGDCPSVCGDATCQIDEDCVDCPQDCGACPEGCGNGVCAVSETCETCSADCGVCVGDCCQEQSGPGCSSALVQACVCNQDTFCCDDVWDGVCVAQVETTGCALCDVVKCGDGLCDPNEETCDTCPEDCGACPVCGDGSCDDNENCGSCPGDCGECAPACCETSNSAGCPEDPSIEACVCAQDFFCCAFSWDSLCVGGVEQFGCGTCP